MNNKIFKIATICVGLLSTSAVLVSCDDDKIYTTDFTLVHPVDDIQFLCNEGDEYPMATGSTYQLTWTVGPEVVDDPTIVFKSSNESVATVDQNGLIKAVGVGDATITATPPIGFGAEATILVHVKDHVVLASELQVAVEGTVEDYYYESDKIQLSATILPADHDYKYITWSSSDESIATVNANGLVTLIKEGNVTITASTNDGSGVKGTWSTRVYKMVNVESLTIAALTDEVCIDRGSFNLDVTYYPEGATTGSVTWSSSNEDVATVERGKVTPKGFGSCTITATAPSGSYATVQVTVANGWRIWDVQNNWGSFYASGSGCGNSKNEARANYYRITFPASTAKYRADFSWQGISATNPVYMNVKEYPILAMRIDHLSNKGADLKIGTHGNIKMDAVDVNSGVNVGSPNPTTIYLSDGSYLFYYGTLASKYPDGDIAWRVFGFKVADWLNDAINASEAYYDVKWIRTFKSVEEAEAFANAEIAAGE
jgi:uncharacterized protein YjdB